MPFVRIIGGLNVKLKICANRFVIDAHVRTRNPHVSILEVLREVTNENKILLELTLKLGFGGDTGFKSSIKGSSIRETSSGFKTEGFFDSVLISSKSESSFRT